MAFNRFGATAADVVNLYPGAPAADFGGESAILAAIDRAVTRILAVIPASVYDTLRYPKLELVADRASEGQTAATLGLVPVVPGSLRLWAIGNGAMRDNLTRPQPGYGETVGFSLTVATGAISNIAPALTEGAYLYASYKVDVESASYSLPSLRDIALYGAAAELGARIYSIGRQEEWALVEAYRGEWETALEQMSKAGWVPPELRALEWYRELEPATSSGIVSVDFRRG